MHLALYRDEPSSRVHFDRFVDNSLLDRLKALNSKARRKGLASLDPERNPLIGLGMEISGRRVLRSGYGVFHLAWQAREHPELPETVASELDQIRLAVRKAHGVPLRNAIWVGGGAAAEEKLAYSAAGLLKRGPRCYVLESASSLRLSAILDELASRARAPLAAALKSTLVAASPAENVDLLAAVYQRCRVDMRSNLVRVKAPADVLAGWHCAPLGRSSLYALGLAKVDLRSWIEGTFLTEDEVHTAWLLSAFVHAQGVHGRDKITLLLPKAWAGAAGWTRRDFEECCGACEAPGLTIVIDEPVRLANYRPPKDALQDRLFLVVQVKGAGGLSGEKLALLRRSGYPLAVLTLERGSPLSKYMQVVHYAAFGLAWLRGVNFVGQSGVGRPAAGIDPSPLRVEWARGVTVQFNSLPMERRQELSGLDAASAYAAFLRKRAGDGRLDFAELAALGDIRYTASGRALRKCLEHAAEKIFRSVFKIPAAVREGTGNGRAFSTAIQLENECEIRAGSEVMIELRGTGDRTMQALDAFFRHAAAALRKR